MALLRYMGSFVGHALACAAWFMACVMARNYWLLLAIPAYWLFMMKLASDRFVKRAAEAKAKEEDH